MKTLILVWFSALVTLALRPDVQVKHWVFPTLLGSKLGLRVFAHGEAEAVEVLLWSTLRNMK
jgi:hypothetical protein